MPWLMTSTYLVCKERFCVALGDIGFIYNRIKHKLSQSKYSAEESTVGIEVSSPTNWLPLPSSSRGIKGVERWVKIEHDMSSEYWFWHVLHTHILKERK